MYVIRTCMRIAYVVSICIFYHFTNTCAQCPYSFRRFCSDPSLVTPTTFFACDSTRVQDIIFAKYHKSLEHYWHYFHMRRLRPRPRKSSKVWPSCRIRRIQTSSASGRPAKKLFAAFANNARKSTRAG